jgi:hypothetical protein
MQVRDAQLNPLTVDSHEALNKPLVPHLPIVRLSPHANFKIRVGWDLYRSLKVTVSYKKHQKMQGLKTYLQREEDREPTDHILALRLHRNRVGA